jgi:transposase
MREATRSTWAARVEAWRKSGQTAEEFAADKPYKGSTLVWRAWQLRREHRGRSKTRDVASRARGQGVPRIALAEVVRRAPAEGPGARVTVEVMGARVSVTRGFDAALLREVVQALRGGR